MVAELSFIILVNNSSRYESDHESFESSTLGTSASPAKFRYPDSVHHLSNKNSFFLFGTTNPARRFLYYNVVKSDMFEGIILLIILVNCVLLALNNPPEEAE